MGVVIMPPLPPMSSEEVQNSRVPSLHGHYPASSLLRTRPPPSRRRPISRGHRLYDRLGSADFAAGRGGLLQLLDASSSPCCRSEPRRSASSGPCPFLARSVVHSPSPTSCVTRPVAPVTA